VYGLKFNEIPKGEIEFEFQGHGNNVNKTIGKRSSSDIVDNNPIFVLFIHMNKSRVFEVLACRIC
jgi:hypothetical protein